MRRILEICLRQSVALNIVFVGLMVVGAFLVLPRVSVERYPNFNFGEVNITTFYPGASVHDVERLVTAKLEDALEGMKSLEFVRTSSSSGRSDLHIKFLDDSDYDSLYDELRFRILGAQSQLPILYGDPLRPFISLLQTDEWLPVVQVNLVSADPENPRSDRAITLLAEELEALIEAVPGVKNVILLGEEHREVVVDLAPDLLLAHGLNFGEIESILRASSASQPAGTAETSAGVRTLRVDARYRTLEEILDTVVRTEGSGRSLRLGELVGSGGARIQSQERISYTRVNGRRAVACKVLKYEKADSRKVVAVVRRECEQFLISRSDQDIDLIYSLDSTVQINDSLGVLRSSLIFGIVLVAFALWMFVGWRNAAITVIGIPFAFVSTIMFMDILGYSLNELSLLAFVLVSGVIVDDAVVVLENIHRHREAGRILRESVLRGTSEVFWPIFNSTATTLAAFLPLLIMTGIVGEFFALIPKAVAVALVISLFEAMLILPIHVVEVESWFGRSPIKTTGESVEDRKGAPGFLGMLARIYDWALGFNLRHKVFCLGGTLLLFLAACGILWQSFTAPQRGAKPILRIQFFPDQTTVITVVTRMPGQASVEETDLLLEAISHDLVNRGPGVIANTTAFSGFMVDSTYKASWAEQFGWMQIELPAEEDRDFAGTILRLEEYLAGELHLTEVEAAQARRLVQLEDLLRRRTAERDDAIKAAQGEMITLEASQRDLASAINQAAGRVELLSGRVQIASQQRALDEARAERGRLVAEAADLGDRLPVARTQSEEAIAKIEAELGGELQALDTERAQLEEGLLHEVGDDPRRLELARGLAVYELEIAALRDLNDPQRLLTILSLDLEHRYERNGVDLEVRAQRDGPPTGSDINVRLTGATEEMVFRASDALASWIREESHSEGRLVGVTNLSDDRGRRSQTLAFHVDPARALENQLRVADVVAYVAGSLEGSYVGDFRAVDEDLPIKLRLSRADRDPTALLGTTIALGDGGRRVLLGDVAEVESGSEVSFLNRWNFRRSVIIAGDIEASSPLNPRAASSIIASWHEENRDQFPGVSIAFGGVAESTARSYTSMAQAFGIAVILIYFILASQFRSYLQPIIILSNVFFAFIGVVLMMAGIGVLVRFGLAQPERALITMQGFIAIIGLTGVVVNDSLVLIDFINRLRGQGMARREAIVQACHWRMRPILMTTITTIAGLAPMAIGIPRFSITWSPMATCFAAGLAVATTLTLLIVPVLYEILTFDRPVSATISKEED